MAYTVTYHGVTQKTFDTLAARAKNLGFSLPEENSGVGCNPEADIAFRFDAGAKTLAVSIRRRPLLMSAGQLYGTLADAIIEMGAESTDALLS